MTTNTPVFTPETFFQKMEEVARLLPGQWKASNTEHFSTCHAHILRSDGVELYVHGGDYEECAEAIGCYPKRDKTGVNGGSYIVDQVIGWDSDKLRRNPRPVMGFNATRPADKLAADFARRIIPPVQELHRKVLDRIEELDLIGERNAHAIEKLAAVWPERINAHAYKRPDDSNGIKADISSSTGDNFAGDVDVKHDGTARLEIDGTVGEIILLLRAAHSPIDLDMLHEAADAQGYTLFVDNDRLCTLKHRRFDPKREREYADTVMSNVSVERAAGFIDGYIKAKQHRHEGLLLG